MQFTFHGLLQIEGSSSRVFSCGLWSSAGPQEKLKLPLSPVCFQCSHHARITVTIAAMGGINWCMSKLKGRMVRWCSLTCICMHRLPVYLPRQTPTWTRPMVAILLLLYNSPFDSKGMSFQVQRNAKPFLLPFHQRATSIWIFCTAPAASHGVDLSSH